MKHSRKILFILVALLIFPQVSVLADTEATQQVTPEITPEVAPEVTPEATPQIQNEAIVSITPDSVLYPVKLLIESVSIGLTFDEDNKAELLVKYANRRIAESEIMQTQDNQELAAKLIDDSLKLLYQANDILEDKNESQAEDAKGILVDIKETEEDIIISLEFMMGENADQECIDELLKKAEEQVVKTLVTSAFLTSKDNFFDAKDDFMDAKDEYKAAKKSGDEEAIAAAYAKVLEAEALKDELEAVKDDFETLKDDAKGYYDDNIYDDDDNKDLDDEGNAYGKQDKDQKSDEDDKNDKDEDKDKEKDKEHSNNRDNDKKKKTKGN